ncbi:XRE family transcriptional regulator [Clostridium botulinum]|uniref:XRE family transcriptional regulator n=1 Tax=Clostridium botulinum TaxID=1491 RepID=UPI003D6CE2BE
MHITPRYIASINNSGQHPSMQIFYELVTLLDVSVDQFFFPNKEADKSTQRRQLESLLDDMSDKGLQIVTATAKEIKKVETEDK